MNANNDRSAPAGDVPEAKPRPAWQPLTPRGVAAFAEASFSRLLLVQTVVALLAAGSVIWLLQKAWFPTITEAIQRLPAQGQLRAGKLEWSAASPVCLAQGRFMAVVVDLDHTGKARSPAHVQVELGRTDFMVWSLFGYARWPYPLQAVVPANQPELAPWWGAWAPALSAMAGLAVALALLAAWAGLATLCFLPVWLLAFLAGRECSLGGSWRVAGAALLPGALLMCGALVLYGCGALDPVRLAVAAAVHVITGCVYLLVTPFCLPQSQASKAAAENPFA